MKLAPATLKALSQEAFFPLHSAAEHLCGGNICLTNEILCFWEKWENRP